MLAASDAAPLPLLVLAERQTAGRGRGTNRWWTQAGALTFSLVLEAPPGQLPSDRWPQVALVAGLAVCEALQSLVPSAELRVKWPNDVYLGRRKVCGILSESVAGWRDRLVIGIGVNVNNRMEGAGFRVQGSVEEKSLGPLATSLIEHDGLPRDLTGALLTVLDQFDLRWRDLLANGFGPLTVPYRERCYLTGKTVTIQQSPAQTLVGFCRGVDDSGALHVQGLAGEHRVRSGSVVSCE